MKITKKTLDKKIADAYNSGYSVGHIDGHKTGRTDGYAEGRKSMVDVKLDAKIKLLNAAGQAFHAISSAVDNANCI